MRVASIVVACTFAVTLPSFAHAQPPAAGNAAGGQTGTQTLTEDAADVREDFEISVFMGSSIDTFAAQELRKYLNPKDAKGANEQLIAGFDFSYRMFGTKKSQRQVWLYGETIHGARSGEVGCSSEDNQQSDVCKIARFENPGVNAPFAVFRQATTLEGMLGLRGEFATLKKENGYSAKLYALGQLGFLTTASEGGDVVDLHQVGLGLLLSGGTFEGSHFQIGYGRNDLFKNKNHGRKIVDALLSFAVPNKPIRPFVQMVIDSDFGNGADNIQTYFGLDIAVLELFK